MTAAVKKLKPKRVNIVSLEKRARVLIEGRSRNGLRR
jgi:hypothetical protein